MPARRLLLAPIATLVAATVAAQQPPRFEDTVTVTATGDEQPAADVAAAVTVVDRDTIEALGTAAAADLLRLVPGVALVRSGLDNNVASLFVRGTASTQTLVLFDGVRLNSPFFGGYDWSVPLTAGIERIEVVRGPYSALYGGDAVGGVVQLVSRRPAGTAVRLLAEAGSAAWRRGEVEASVAGERWSVVAVGASRAGTGPLANDDFDSSTALVDVGYRVGSNGRIGILARRTSAATGIPFDGGRISPERRTETDETIVAVPLSLHLGTALRLDASVSRVECDLAFRDPDDPWGFTASDTAADTLAGTATVRASWGGHRTAAGVEWRRDRVSDASSYGVNLDRLRLTTRSAFVQDAAALGRGLSLVAGLRWDEAQPWGSELSPRVTLGWTGGGVHTWVAYGQAFRAPGLGDLYYPGFGNPDLVPEHSRSIEAGVRRPVAGGVGEAVVFRNRIDDLIDFDFVSQRSANIAEARQDGVELSWTVPLGAGSARSQVSWLDARDGTGAPLRRRPEWSSSLLWCGPLAGAVAGAVEVAWIGDRPDIDPLTFEPVRLGAFVTATASATVPVSGSVRVRLRVENLADRRYQEAAGYPAPGRRAMIGVETSWN